MASKNKEKANTIEKSPLGNLANTSVLLEMSKVAPNKRNAAWQTKFVEHLAKASLKPSEPQVVTGPDGFPYFNLEIPRPGENFQSYCIEEMIDEFLLENGFGVVINASYGEPDWILSFGDLINYSISKSFYSYQSMFNTHQDEEGSIAEEEEVTIGFPPNDILPQSLRYALREFFKANGLKQTVKVLLMGRKSNGNMVYDLVFNLTPAMFPNLDTFRAITQAMAFFLPRHYSFISIDEKAIENGFQNL
ncbi:hypothetical protein [Olivibacter sitiensis]|uniref:hypothetical protein n=1 Tax=Olivibacter sitiensis TaxID=376470 RepID=UPI00040D1D30|nr:hypothetical protein [Olivibacter sitiensis]